MSLAFDTPTIPLIAATRIATKPTSQEMVRGRDSLNVKHNVCAMRARKNSTAAPICVFICVLWAQAQHADTVCESGRGREGERVRKSESESEREREKE